jgi:lipopolysaccharide assembly protein A
MQIVRTILWVLLLAALLLFAVTNWTPVELRIWDGIVLETRLPALVIVAFALGLVPMWLLHRARVWTLKRRIASLESSVRTAALTPATATTPPATAPVTAPATPPAEPAPAGTPHPFGEPL